MLLHTPPEKRCRACVRCGVPQGGCSTRAFALGHGNMLVWCSPCRVPLPGVSVNGGRCRMKSVEPLRVVPLPTPCRTSKRTMSCNGK